MRSWDSLPLGGSPSSARRWLTSRLAFVVLQDLRDLLVAAQERAKAPRETSASPEMLILVGRRVPRCRFARRRKHRKNSGEEDCCAGSGVAEHCERWEKPYLFGFMYVARPLAHM